MQKIARVGDVATSQFAAQWFNKLCATGCEHDYMLCGSWRNTSWIESKECGLLTGISASSSPAIRTSCSTTISRSIRGRSKSSCGLRPRLSAGVGTQQTVCRSVSCPCPCSCLYLAYLSWARREHSASSSTAATAYTRSSRSAAARPLEIRNCDNVVPAHINLTV